MNTRNDKLYKVNSAYSTRYTRLAIPAMQKSINLLFTVHDFTYLVILFNLNSEDPWVGMEASVQACSAMANTQEDVSKAIERKIGSV